MVGMGRVLSSALEEMRRFEASASVCLQALAVLSYITAPPSMRRTSPLDDSGRGQTFGTR